MLSGLSYSPSISPVDPSFLHRHMRLMSPTDYAMADAYAQIATEIIENHTSRFLLTKNVVWTTARDHDHHDGIQVDVAFQPWQWSSYLAQPVIRLPRPATAISSVTIGLWGEDDVTLIDGIDYVADFTTPLARIKWISSLSRQMNRDHLQIAFTSGYGEPASVPSSLKYAVVILALQLFEARGDVNPDVLSPPIAALIAPYQFVSFG
jgi:uncharacterized phiE125 gp8 family phage protein